MLEVTVEAGGMTCPVGQFMQRGCCEFVRSMKRVLGGSWM